MKVHRIDEERGKRQLEEDAKADVLPYDRKLRSADVLEGSIVVLILVLVWYHPELELPVFCLAVRLQLE